MLSFNLVYIRKGPFRVGFAVRQLISLEKVANRYKPAGEVLFVMAAQKVSRFRKPRVN